MSNNTRNINIRKAFANACDDIDSLSRGETGTFGERLEKIAKNSKHLLDLEFGELIMYGDDGDHDVTDDVIRASQHLDLEDRAVLLGFATARCVGPNMKFIKYILSDEKVVNKITVDDWHASICHCIEHKNTELFVYLKGKMEQRNIPVNLEHKEIRAQEIDEFDESSREFLKKIRLG